MLTMYAIPVSLYCAKLRILLRHKQIDFEEVPPPGGYGSDEYKALVPAGSLPAIVHDGLQIADSEAIAEYLNETYPEPDMLPEDAGQRAKIRELSRFHDTRLEPALRALFPHISDSKGDDGFVDRQWEVLCDRLDQLEVLIPTSERPLTLADCGLPVTATWIFLLGNRFGKNDPISSKFARYLANLEKHAAVANELASYRAKLNDWLATQ